MQTLGEFLKHGRQEAGLSLEDLAGKTRIRVENLDSLEREDLESLPTDPYVRGFVKLVCRELGLEPADGLVRYESLRESHGPTDEITWAEESETVETTVLERVLGNPERIVRTVRRFGRWGLVTAGAVVLVVAGTAAYRALDPFAPRARGPVAFLATDPAPPSDPALMDVPPPVLDPGDVPVPSGDRAGVGFATSDPSAVPAAPLAAERDAAREEAARQEAVRREAERQEAARQEAARQEAARQEVARQEAARQEAERQEAARLESERLESERARAAREEAAREEAAREEAAREEAAREEAARAEAARAEAEERASIVPEPVDPVIPPYQEIAVSERPQSAAPATDAAPRQAVPAVSRPVVTTESVTTESATPEPVVPEPVAASRPARVPEPSEVRAPVPPSSDRLVLEVTALRTVEVTVLLDGVGHPRTRTLEAGQTKRWKADRLFVLSAGDGGAVRLALSGTDLGVPGSRGTPLRDLRILPR